MICFSVYCLSRGPYRLLLCDFVVCLLPFPLVVGTVVDVIGSILSIWFSVTFV